MSKGTQWDRRGWWERTASIAAVSMAIVLAGPHPGRAQDRGLPWFRHAIDDTSQGADGVRLDDVDGDGLMDIATGWEEGDAVRAYIHPGTASVADPWPRVTVGVVGDVEDAVFVDLDGDGAKDVVSCAEGTTRGVFVHWAPPAPGDYLNPAAWQTVKIPASAGLAWMFAVPLQVDGNNGVDLVAGCKWGGKVGWFEAPGGNPRDLSQWAFHEMSGVGWTMSLIPHDMDSDGDLDILVTDRYNDVGLQGARWLENPGTGTAAQKSPWPNHFVGGQGQEVMLSTMVDLDEDGLTDLVLPIRTAPDIWFYRRLHPVLNNWQAYPIAVPDNVGTPKACEVADIDLDDDPDLVLSFANCPTQASGVVWLSYVNSPMDLLWEDHEISGPEGTKFDLVALDDLDGDGDLDVITTEEVTGGGGLGLIWYENPTLAPVPGDFDHDGDVDLVDFSRLQVCLSDLSPPSPGCQMADLYRDDWIDELDVMVFRNCMSGANVPADPDCAD
jgi:hypothetical protein